MKPLVAAPSLLVSVKNKGKTPECSGVYLAPQAWGMFRTDLVVSPNLGSAPFDGEHRQKDFTPKLRINQVRRAHPATITGRGTQEEIRV